MKKFNFSKLAAALAASAMILTAAFTGCSSSSSGGGGGDDEDGKIESVSVTSSTAEAVESGSPVTLTATVAGDISDDNVTYAWEVTENADYGTLNAPEGKEVTLTLTNEDENAHIVKVTLTATNKNDSENTAADNAYVTVKGKDGSSELPESEKQLEEEKEEEEKKEAEAGKTGTVSIKVAVDDSENPTYTVIFNDTAEEGYTAQESVTKTVEYGDTVAAPEWTRDGYSLTWTSSVDGVTVNSDITADVTFTAVWTKIVYYTVTFHDSDGTNADDVQSIASGKTAKIPSWTKDGFTLTWDSNVSGLAPASAITTDVTFTTEWTEKPKCSNCGTHYDTQAEADACSVKEGCPKFEAVVAGTYDLSSSGIFSKQSAGKTQTAKGITVTCMIDSKGANLKTGNGSIAFAIASDMTLTFTDSNSKGVVIKTTGGYIGKSGTTTSETLTSASALKLGAGSYTIEGATKSSAKIKTLTFAAVSE